jgi:SAM-dependent methyltransferase
MKKGSAGGVVERSTANRSEHAEYGNWVSTRFVAGPALAAVVLAILALAADVLGVSWLFGVLLGAAVLAALVAAYFAYARHLLAAGAGDVQARVQELVLERLPWDGKGRALDIGCGNGPLTIALARRFSEAQVTGIDFWGESWEYSQDVCESNAASQGVGERVSFQRASAAALPFADGSFAAVVSNLCFHEVRGVRDKREVVREALRVLELGGAFAFQDLFRLKSSYGEIDDLLTAIRGWGVASVEYVDTGKADFVPGALRLPFMVGSMGMLYGKK